MKTTGNGSREKGRKKIVIEHFHPNATEINFNMI